MAPAPRSKEPREIVRRRVSDLLLDPENPRIFVRKSTSQARVLKYLFENEALEELALSFSRNGYFTEEPIVVVPGGQRRFIVVEGNRRVATLKILLDPQLRKRLGAENWPVLSAKRLRSLQQVPTVKYGSRSDVVPYLGFRHITGAKTWDPPPCQHP